MAKLKSEKLTKISTGIQGLDEITFGGLPKGRSTLICGGAGCGKTLLGTEILVFGATKFDEPGVLVSFEENENDIIKNVASLGYDLNDLIRSKKLVIDHIHIERSEILLSGEFNLDGLFIRLDHAIRSTGAKRVMLDTIEALFGGLVNPLILRSELSRLFNWLREKGVTAIVTAESDDNKLTRQGIEEFVSDCVIALDHRIENQVSTRRLRIVKYRGSTHGTNEYPFLIDETGISVVPVTSLGLRHEVSSQRVSSGIERLDIMLGGMGYFRGSSVLISGTAGGGKTSLAAHFTDACCRRNERALYFSFEESPGQIIRNMRSIGVDLEQWEKKGLLQFHANRPSFYGLEMHLAMMYKAVNDFKPDIVVIDPINGLTFSSDSFEIKVMLLRLIDFLKSEQITTLFTSLTSDKSNLEHTDVAISSLIDTWLLLRDIESDGERNRGLYILKSRGMAHSNQIREFLLTDHGVELLDVYLGQGGVLTGSARRALEAKEQAELLTRKQEIEQKQRELERKRLALEMKIAIIRNEFEAEEAETMKLIEQENAREEQLLSGELDMAKSRKADQ